MNMPLRQQAERINTSEGSSSSHRTERAWALFGVVTVVGVLALGATGCGTAQPNDCRTFTVPDEQNEGHILGFKAIIYGQHNPSETYVNASTGEHISQYIKNPEATIRLGELGFDIGPSGVATMHVRQGVNGTEINCAPTEYTNTIPRAIT